MFSNDFVRINAKMKYCGSQSQFALTIRQSLTTLMMYSDGGLEETGFHATYFLIPNNNEQPGTRFDFRI